MVFAAIIIGFTILWTYSACTIASEADAREEKMLTKDMENTKDDNSTE